jgi:hypothetical protein
MSFSPQRRSDTVRRSHRSATVLELRAVYSIAEPAKSAGISWYAMRRLLPANKVTFLHSGRAVLVPLPEIQKHVPQLWEALIDVEQLRVAGVKANPAPGSSAPASQNLQEAFESGQTACHRSQTTFSSSRTSVDARNRPFDENESTGEEMTRHLSFSKGSLDGSGRPKGHFFRITCQLEKVECRTVHELWVLRNFVCEIRPRPSRARKFVVQLPIVAGDFEEVVGQLSR